MISVNEIDALLPQTQCGECGYQGCYPYAEALVQGNTTIDRCPPGGKATLQALAAHLGVDPTPYLASIKTRDPAIAVIREAECIGCTKCIQACPVDAIVGAGKVLHHILTHECTGCGLCVEPCPVDCIDILPQAEPCYEPNVARERYQAKKIRQLREAQAAQKKYHEKRLLANASQHHQEKEAKKDYILQALARSKQKGPPK